MTKIPRLLLLTLALILAVRPVASAAELADPELRRELGKLFIGGLTAVADADIDTVVATADASLLAHIEAERPLVLSLPRESLLPPFDSEAAICAPPSTAVRILLLRKSFPAGAIDQLDSKELLEATLGVWRGPAHWARDLVGDAGSEERLQGVRDIEAEIENGRVGFIVEGDHAYLDIPYAHFRPSIAIRQADGTWRYDYLNNVVLEMERNLLFLFAHNRRPDPKDWTPEFYLEQLAFFLPPALTDARLQHLTEPLRPGGTYQCLPPPLQPPLVMLKGK